MTTSIVTPSRKLCTSPHHRGARWLPAVYFHVYRWTDESKTAPRRLQSWCQTCQRIGMRLKNGYKIRKPSHIGVRSGSKGYEPQTPDEWERYRAYQRQKYAGLSESQQEERREYQRIRTEALRREAGIEPRKLKRLERVFQGANQHGGEDEPMLDPQPLAKLIKNHLDHTSISAISKRGQTSPSKVKEVLSCAGPVGLDLADRILTGLDCTHMLYVLYPQED